MNGNSDCYMLLDIILFYVNVDTKWFTYLKNLLKGCIQHEFKILEPLKNQFLIKKKLDEPKILTYLTI